MQYNRTLPTQILHTFVPVDRRTAWTVGDLRLLLPNAFLPLEPVISLLPQCHVRLFVFPNPNDITFATWGTHG